MGALSSDHQQMRNVIRANPTYIEPKQLQELEYDESDYDLVYGDGEKEHQPGDLQRYNSLSAWHASPPFFGSW